MEAWNKRRGREQDEKLDCIIKNQVAIMEAVEKQLYTEHGHTVRYGCKYQDKLTGRVAESRKLMHGQKGGKQAWVKIKGNAIR